MSYQRHRNACQSWVDAITISDMGTFESFEIEIISSDVTDDKKI